MKTWIERNDKEIEIEIRYHISKGMKGRRDKYGAPEEPDDESELEILSIVDHDGIEIELSNDEEEKIEELCWEDAESYDP